MPLARFSSKALAASVSDVIAAAGVPVSIARAEAELMVEADLCGVPSHGVVMLPRLLAGLRDGRVTPDPIVRTRRERGATCVLDGDNGPGRYVAMIGMERAMEMARRDGVGVCLVTNTTHWGRAHAYAARAAREGVIGLCTTNAIPTMIVPGLPTAVLGNNPLAIGVPRPGGEDPVVLDIAMTQAALGKVATYRREGRPVPGDWGLDTEGRPTDDPAAILSSGLLLPMGGHKGIGLAVMMELLTAGLAGGPLGHEIAQSDASGLDPGATKLFLAMDVAAFGDRPAFDARVDALLAHLGAVDPDHRVLAPGERGWRARREHERDGVPLHPDIVRLLREVGVVLPAS